MNRSTERLLRWSLATWLWTFAVLAGLAAGELVKKWPEPTDWDTPSQLANGNSQMTLADVVKRGRRPRDT